MKTRELPVEYQARAKKNDAPDSEQLDVVRRSRNAKTYQRRSLIDPAKPISVAQARTPDEPKGGYDATCSENTRGVIQANPDRRGWHKDDCEQRQNGQQHGIYIRQEHQGACARYPRHTFACVQKEYVHATGNVGIDELKKIYRGCRRKQFDEPGRSMGETEQATVQNRFADKPAEKAGYAHAHEEP